MRLLLESGLPLLWLEGELSNFAAPASGHWYFSLKDSTAQVRCAMWRQRNSQVRFRPKDGMAVLARARVGLYEPRGEYQLLVEHLEEAGEGALKREFEKLKARLAAEGLFAAERKRPLPAVPRRIGVVTSPTGAAIHDILRVLRARFPAAGVLLYPTAVQGAAAVPEIVRAIEAASRRNECDVLIVARGGGSLEDLWCFNDERVARAIAACRMPTVSGVGPRSRRDHRGFRRRRARTDAFGRGARRRARQAALARNAGAAGDALRLAPWAAACARRRWPSARSRSGCRSRIRARDSRSTRNGWTIWNSACDSRCAPASLRQQQRLETLSTRLWRENPRHRLEALCAHAAALRQRLVTAFSGRLNALEQRLALASRTLDAVSPLATLGRGFAVVSRVDDGALLRDAATAPPGTEIEARLAKGRLRAPVVAPDQGRR